MTNADDLAFHLSALLKSPPADHAKAVLEYLDPEKTARAPAWLRGLAAAIEIEATASAAPARASDASKAPILVAMLERLDELERDRLEPSRVTLEINILSSLMIEARGCFERFVWRDADGVWYFRDLPLTLVARADVPARGWTILTKYQREGKAI